MAASFLLLLWLLDTLGALLAPFILAFVIAYILDPIVAGMEARGIKRGLAIAILAVPGIVVITLIILFGVPALAQQIESLIERLPAALERGVNWLEGLGGRLRAARLPFFKGESLERALASFSPERVAQYINQQQAEIGRRLLGAVMGVGKGVTIVLSVLGYLVITPVLAIYLLVDFDELIERVGSLIPRAKRAAWLAFGAEYDRLLSRYLRGQISAAVIVGTLTWIGLFVLGFPYSGLVGAIAGVFNIVPYLGLIASIIPAVIVALLSGSIVASLIKIAVVFGIVQVIDSTITGPRIVGGSVGLHPVWVILALAVGSFFFGFVGLLLAMPAAVFIKLVVRDALARYRDSRVFEGEKLSDE
jgi:predicted PurR-regulated permease PerM